MAYNLLKGKKGLIFGALNEDSIAWKVAERAVEEGAEIVLSNAPVSFRFGEINKLAEKLGTIAVPCDVSKVKDIEELFDKTTEHFGGKFDFILHSIGMSMNVRKKNVYNEANYEYFMKAIDISALSFHKVIAEAHKRDALNEYGSIVALSYIAAQRTFFGYNDMAEAKAMLESIARSFGYVYGRDKNVRINTISQSPTKTTAGNGIKGFDMLYDYSEMNSPMGNASADECADFCVAMFSDFTRKVTMQNLFHDGGYSSVGVTSRAFDHFTRSVEKENAEQDAE